MDHWIEGKRINSRLAAGHADSAKLGAIDTILKVAKFSHHSERADRMNSYACGKVVSGIKAAAGVFTGDGGSAANGEVESSLRPCRARQALVAAAATKANKCLDMSEAPWKLWQRGTSPLRMDSTFCTAIESPICTFREPVNVNS